MKLSRADLAFAISDRPDGATTVAATMIAAARAGIHVFATGGIGGVHRGAEQSFDISADLEELARTPVIVVCAGAKAILDVPKTLEVLETKGVPVVTFGQRRFSGLLVAEFRPQGPLRLDTGRDRRFQHMREALGIAGGMLIANPVPERDEIPPDEMEGYIAGARQRRRNGHRRQSSDAFLARRASTTSPKAGAWPPTFRLSRTMRGWRRRSRWHWHRIRAAGFCPRLS